MGRRSWVTVLVALGVAISLAAVGWVAIRRQTQPVVAQNLSGVWQQPGEPMVGHPTRRMLHFLPDGHGSLWSEALGVSAGMGMSWDFDYRLVGSRVILRFDDGVTESLLVDSLTREKFEARPGGNDSRVVGGTWRRTGWW